MSRKPDDSSSNPLNVLEYNRDSVFAWSVWSVEINVAIPTRAALVEKETEWIMPRALTQANDPATANPQTKVPWMQIKVGDVVHVGSTHTVGYSDYLVVVEIKDDIAELWNTTDATVSISSTGSASLLSAVSVACANAGSRAIRVNKAINYTTLPSYPQNVNHLDPLAAQITVGLITNANWQDGYKYLSSPQNWYTEDSGVIPGTGTAYALEPYFYPLYRVIPWQCTGAGSRLKVDLARSTKRLRSITLRGYHFSLVGDLGHHASSEMQVLDTEYYILRIKELVEGRVISNNPAANGSFAVLQVGSSSFNENGCYEYSRYADGEDGIATLHLPTPKIMGSLTLELFDRLGKPAQLGHGHFWFSIVVED